MNVVVVERKMPFVHQFVVYSQDARGIHGTGHNEEEAKQYFIRMVEDFLIDGEGFIFWGQSSSDYQMQKIRASWKVEEIEAIKPDTVVLFCDSSPYSEVVPFHTKLPPERRPDEWKSLDDLQLDSSDDDSDSNSEAHEHPAVAADQTIVPPVVTGNAIAKLYQSVNASNNKKYLICCGEFTSTLGKPRSFRSFQLARNHYEECMPCRGVIHREFLETDEFIKHYMRTILDDPDNAVNVRPTEEDFEDLELLHYAGNN